MAEGVLLPWKVKPQSLVFCLCFTSERPFSLVSSNGGKSWHPARRFRPGVDEDLYGDDYSNDVSFFFLSAFPFSLSHYFFE